MAKNNSNSRKALRLNPQTERPQSFLFTPLTWDARTFFKGLTKAVVHGVQLKPLDLIADSAEMTSAIGLKTPSEQLAWRLVNRSLQLAVVHLILEAKDVFAVDEAIEEKITKSTTNIENVMSNMTVEINNTFFQRPGDMPVVKWMQRSLNQWLLNCHLNQAQADGISSRLPAVFVFAMHNEYRKHLSTYESLAKSFQSPFTSGLERETQWNRYSAWLTQQADQRMFDETFGLRQIYVPLRASFTKRKGSSAQDSKEVLSPAYSRHENRENQQVSKQQVAWLSECLEHWLEKWDKHDAIRVLRTCFEIALT